MLENPMTKPQIAMPKYITFDAYGTLVQYQLNKAIRVILGERGNGIDMEKFEDDHHDLRFQEILGEYRPYEVMLRRGLHKIMSRYGLDYTEEDSDRMMDSIPNWPPFPDVPAVLRKLRMYTKIVIISNSEDRLIEKNIECMGATSRFFLPALSSTSTPASFFVLISPRSILSTTIRRPSLWIRLSFQKVINFGT